MPFETKDKHSFLALVIWGPWKRWQRIILPRQHRRNAGTQSGQSPERPLWSPAEDQTGRCVYGDRSSPDLEDLYKYTWRDLNHWLTARPSVITIIVGRGRSPFPNGWIPEERTRLRAATECWQTDSLAGGKWANNTDEPGVLIICCLHPLTLLG